MTHAVSTEIEVSQSVVMQLMQEGNEVIIYTHEIDNYSHSELSFILAITY